MCLERESSIICSRLIHKDSLSLSPLSYNSQIPSHFALSGPSAMPCFKDSPWSLQELQVILSGSLSVPQPSWCVSTQLTQESLLWSPPLLQSCFLWPNVGSFKLSQHSFIVKTDAEEILTLWPSKTSAAIYCPSHVRSRSALPFISLSLLMYLQDPAFYSFCNFWALPGLLMFRLYFCAIFLIFTLLIFWFLFYFLQASFSSSIYWRIHYLASLVCH